MHAHFNSAAHARKVAQVQAEQRFQRSIRQAQERAAADATGAGACQGSSIQLLSDAKNYHCLACTMSLGGSSCAVMHADSFRHQLLRDQQHFAF